MPSELILQFMQPNGHFDCEMYSNIPSPQSSYIAIAYTNSAIAQQRAVQLKRALLSQLQGLNAGINFQIPRCQGGSGDFGNCYAISDRAFNKRMLIIVGDGITLPAHLTIPAVLNNDIVPVLHQGEHFNFVAPVNVANCLWWQSNIDETLVFILNRMGVSSEQQRIFISYRQTDTTPLANQLFDTLSHNGFDVFVDRFSIEPGVNFQNRLYQQLRDKAMVLFIESEHYLESKWVQLEIAFAKKYRLAYHVFNFKGADKIDSIHDANRTLLNTGDLTPEGSLLPHVLESKIMDIKRLHMYAMYRRRHYMNLNLYVALKYKHCNAVSYRNDVVNAESNGQHYTLFSSPRPPQAEDYFFADNLTPNRKVLYGPEYVEENRRNVNTWLADKAHINYFHEGELLNLADKIITNTTTY